MIGNLVAVKDTFDDPDIVVASQFTFELREVATNQVNDERNEQKVTHN